MHTIDALVPLFAMRILDFIAVVSAFWTVTSFSPSSSAVVRRQNDAFRSLTSSDGGIHYASSSATTLSMSSERTYIMVGCECVYISDFLS